MAAWSVEPLAYRLITGTTAGLWRVTIGARRAETAFEIVAIAKELRAFERGSTRVADRFAPSLDPAHWNYWHRQVDALSVAENRGDPGMTL